MKRIFLIHGWGGHPEEAWFPWIKKELEKRNYKVTIPKMPNPESPNIDKWILHIKNVVGDVDEDTYFIEHSVGCFAILHYLESLKKDEKIGGCVFVGGWVELKVWEGQTAEEAKIIHHWINSKPDFEKIKQHTNKYIAIFSDNDPFVPLKNAEIFEKNLGAKAIIEHAKGHFNDESNVKKLPSVLNAILQISK